MSRSGTPLSLVAWAILLTGLLVAFAATPGVLTMRSVESKRTAVERSIDAEEQRAYEQHKALRHTSVQPAEGQPARGGR